MGRGLGIRAVSKSSIQIDFTYRGVRCREKLRLKPTKANMSYAVRIRGEIENAIARGTFNYAEYFPNSNRALMLAPRGFTITIAEALEKYLKYASGELQRSTWLDYRNSVRNKLIPAFGTIPLSVLTRQDIKAWITTQNVSSKRIWNILLPLRSVLADAVADGIIQTNPLYGWTPRVKETGQAKSNIDPFNVVEIRTILDAARTDSIRNLLQFGFWTGLRTSELIAARWEDVEDGLIHVCRARVRGEIKPPKTRNGIRHVKLLNPAMGALKRQRAETFFKQEWIFTSPSGGPWRDDNQLRKVAWIPTLLKSGVKYRYPYQMRHTFASLMCSAGENVHWIANQMGHSDTTMVARNYGKWIPEANPNAGKKAELLWNM